MSDPAPTMIHDWTSVPSFVWGDFHAGWIGELRKQLNGGVLSDPFYAVAETQGGLTVESAESPDGNGLSDDHDDPVGGRRFVGDLLSLREGHGSDGGGGLAVAEAPPHTRLTLQAPTPTAVRRILIRHASGDRVVALIELVSPGNRDGRRKIESFCDHIEAAVGGGVHVLLVDLFPPTNLLPDGIQGAVAERFGIDYDPPPDEPLCCAAYRAAGPATTSFIEPLAVGAPVPTMPLFLTTDRYVNLPLAESYAEAFGPTPRKYKALLDPAAAPA